MPDFGLDPPDSSRQRSVVWCFAMSDALLEIEHLVTSFTIGGRKVRAVDDVGLRVLRGETLALVGESGCGKSVTALSTLRLVPSPPGTIESGRILFDGRNLLDLDDASMRAVRGNRIAMIFQEPMTSLNPVYTVGSQIAEALRLHRNQGKRAARERTQELLGLVGIPSPSESIDAYPHQLSGGMRQRVMIAMALACDPDLLIADEPTTALDVTIQAQILELLQRLQQSTNMSILFITHDLGIVAQFADRVVVMYAGRVVESAAVVDLFSAPWHPYTRGLLNSVPALAARHPRTMADKRLPAIEGSVPTPGQSVPGCRFAERCSRRTQLGEVARRCSLEEPLLQSSDGQRSVRCHFPLEASSS